MYIGDTVINMMKDIIIQVWDAKEANLNPLERKALAAQYEKFYYDFCDEVESLIILAEEGGEVEK